MSSCVRTPAPTPVCEYKLTPPPRSFLDPANCADLTIPHLLLASADESAEAVAGYKAALAVHKIAAVKEKSVADTYEDMFHGWMAARSKLAEEKYRLGYERGYAQVVEWLKGTLVA